MGQGRIVQALLGSRTRTVLDARLDQLSTYGLLREEGSSYLNALFRELQAAGLLEQNRVTGSSGNEFQLVTLSPLGDEVMRGKSPCELAWPSRDGVGSNAGRREKKRDATGNATDLDFDAELPVDHGLLAALKKKREEIAREAGNLPRYQIFPDETLKAFARLKPADYDAGRRIRGVGEFKAERYLDQFLTVIQEYESVSQ